MPLVIHLHWRSCQTIALAVSPTTPTYIIIVFMLLMTLTLFFLPPESPLLVVQKEKMQGNSKTTNPTKAACCCPAPPAACLCHQTIASCFPLPLPSQQSLSSAAASCRPPSLLPSHVCHRHLLLFAVAASCPPLLSSVVRCHCPLMWLIVMSCNVTLSSLSLSSSLPLSSLPCCFVAVITITRPRRWHRLSLPLPLCNASKFEARWRGMEIGEVSPSGRKNVGPSPHRTLQDADCNIVVDGEDNSTMAGKHGQHWGRGERSFSHG
jgi:hypothetical protein